MSNAEFPINSNSTPASGESHSEQNESQFGSITIKELFADSNFNALIKKHGIQIQEIPNFLADGKQITLIGTDSNCLVSATDDVTKNLSEILKTICTEMLRVNFKYNRLNNSTVSSIFGGSLTDLRKLIALQDPNIRSRSQFESVTEISCVGETISYRIIFQQS